MYIISQVIIYQLQQVCPQSITLVVAERVQQKGEEEVTNFACVTHVRDIGEFRDRGALSGKKLISSIYLGANQSRIMGKEVLHVKRTQKLYRLN